LQDDMLWDTVDATWGHFTCIFLCYQGIITFWPGKHIWCLLLAYFVKSTRNLFSMMTRCIPNYSKDDIDFPTNYKASHRRTIKLQVVASVSGTV
jgi:hypothetical protein